MSNLRFWFQWVAATAVGWGLTGAAMEVGGPIGVGGSWALLVCEALVGLAQWYFLKRRIKRSGHWIWVSAASWAAGIGMLVGLEPTIGNLMLVYDVSVPVAYVIVCSVYAVASAVVGVVQWLFLRGKVKSAGWWIPTIVISVAVASIVASLLAKVSESWFFLTSVFGMVSGASTGVVLVLLLQRGVRKSRIEQ